MCSHQRTLDFTLPSPLSSSSATREFCLHKPQANLSRVGRRAGLLTAISSRATEHRPQPLLAGHSGGHTPRCSLTGTTGPQRPGPASRPLRAAAPPAPRGAEIPLSFAGPHRPRGCCSVEEGPELPRGGGSRGKSGAKEPLCRLRGPGPPWPPPSRSRYAPRTRRHSRAPGQPLARGGFPWQPPPSAPTERRAF